MSRTKEEYAAQIYAAEEHHRKQASGRDDDAMLVAIIIGTGYICYKAVEGAVKVTVTGSKLIENAYKIGGGQIAVLGTDPESKTTYITKHPSPRGNTSTPTQPMTTNPVEPSEQTSPNTPTSKREKAKIYGKKLVDNAKIGAKTLSNAYKMTTGKIEVVGPGSDFNSNGKEKFIFSDPTQRKIIQKEFKTKKGYKCGIALEETIKVSLTLSLNNKRIVKITEFRSIIVPDVTEDREETFDISLILKYSDGSNMPKDDPAFLKIHYGRDGKLNKLSLPNTPIIFHNQWYPALTVYKGEL